MELTLPVLVGKTFTKVEKLSDPKESSSDEIVFTVSDDEKYKLYHSQDCCETVNIKDICGDLNDLVGVPLLQAVESTNQGESLRGGNACNTWTFYRFATIKGSVVISWEGESNGFYSERVDFAKV